MNVQTPLGPADSSPKQPMPSPKTLAVVLPRHGPERRHVILKLGAGWRTIAAC